jgi:hypothetical protein
MEVPRSTSSAAKGKRQLPRSTSPVLTVEEGRRQLHTIAREFGELEQASENLTDRAVEVGPHRRGGLVLLPKVDVEEAERRRVELEREHEELLDDLEVFGISLLAEERLSSPTPVEQLLTIEKLAREHGLEDLVAG